ncbi:MAG: RsbRD N-terminal domain-containing protein [Deltaproteobacteria bacterium]|nr:RsbRD N-terminal domain-containing protein [Deltaproteobacteria bacterium]MBW1953265.1 RsbRD N-terminal domain-containing protein [Deltaproteobacteria bacterium]MBW1986410.1 RsbRD N-terminal domain-containing protein [Deltaproteobacteria bacterium]MBW2133805.1 RsbRD N-terminal domain-containing protein [Deltaproteobacteria bacterium]
MKLKEFLIQHEVAIVKRWADFIFGTYPAETTQFLKKEKNRFDNPVAYQVNEGLKGLYKALVHDMEAEELNKHLDEIIRIRAIQDFSPAQAVAFIFLLKNVIREQFQEHFKGEVRIDQLSQDCFEFESRIDGLALLGFNVYMNRREQLHKIRLEEVRNKVSGLLRRTGMTIDYH